MLLAVVANRVAMALLTLAGVAVVVFVLLRVVPGDPVAMMISPGAGPRIGAPYGSHGWPPANAVSKVPDCHFLARAARTSAGRVHGGGATLIAGAGRRWHGD